MRRFTNKSSKSVFHDGKPIGVSHESIFSSHSPRAELRKKQALGLRGISKIVHLDIFLVSSQLRDGVVGDVRPACQRTDTEQNCDIQCCVAV